EAPRGRRRPAGYRDSARARLPLVESPAGAERRSVDGLARRSPGASVRRRMDRRRSVLRHLGLSPDRPPVRCPGILHVLPLLLRAPGAAHPPALLRLPLLPPLRGAADPGPTVGVPSDRHAAWRPELLLDLHGQRSRVPAGDGGSHPARALAHLVPLRGRAV